MNSEIRTLNFDALLALHAGHVHVAAVAEAPDELVVADVAHGPALLLSETDVYSELCVVLFAACESCVHDLYTKHPMNRPVPSAAVEGPECVGLQPQLLLLRNAVTGSA